MDTEQLSEIITQVIKTMYPEQTKIQQKSKALVIAEDTENQLTCIDQYKNLDGCSVSLLISKNAEAGHMGTASYECVYVSEELACDCSSWIKQFDQVFIPCPSLKLISKLAHIIVDDKFTEAIFSALQNQKQVFIGKMADEKTANLAPALKNEVQKLVEKLQSYGIKHYSAETSQNQRSGQQKNVISASDVAEMVKGGTELYVANSTIITPLAMDYIRDKKITLKRMG